MAVIRMTGEPGSGKSTLAKAAAAKLDYGLYQVGKIFKNLALKERLSIEEFYKSLNDPALEREIDAIQENLMLTRDRFIVDGRMAPWLKCGFRAVNVKLTVGADEGAERLLRRPENARRTLEEMKRFSAERVDVERERYRSLYGIEDHLAEGHFDIILDTTRPAAEETLQQFLAEFRERFQ